MIVFGGARDSSTFNSGGRYSPQADDWTATSTVNTEARAAHTCVWTGSKMIVFGGLFSWGIPTNTGGIYDPKTDQWVALTQSNAPEERHLHSAVWTGSKIIVFGGSTSNVPGAGYINSGGQYSPAAQNWNATSTTGAPLARGLHQAVWTGNKMIVWGGTGSDGLLTTGFEYVP